MKPSIRSTGIAFLLLGIGLARCARPWFYVNAILTIVPFVVIPVALGTAVTLLLVNTFPARRARDLLMLMGLLFAGSSSSAIANPIGQVLSFLGATMVGN